MVKAVIDWEEISPFLEEPAESKMVKEIRRMAEENGIELITGKVVDHP